MIKKIALLLFSLTMLFSLKAQFNVESTLLADSLGIGGDKKAKTTHEGDIVTFHWKSQNYLVDLNFLRADEAKKNSVYGLVLNTNIKDTVEMTVTKKNKDEFSLAVLGKTFDINSKKSYKLSFSDTNGFSEDLLIQADNLGVDMKIDLAFGKATGGFVSLIFAQIPIGTVNDELNIDVTNPGEGYNLVEKNDSVYLSQLAVKKRVASSLQSSNDKVIISGGSFKMAKADIPANGIVAISASASHSNVYWVLILLIGGALFFTFYFNFINIKGFFTSINIVRGKHDDLEEGHHGVEVSKSEFTGEEDNPDTIRVEGNIDGEVSHFQALTAALSATVGLGNIAGVAIALSIGGPGATFWMIIAGLLGMSSKFVECTLGVKYREIGSDGTVYGGPMYYLKKGLAEKKLAGLGKVLAVLFAIMCIGGSFGGGNMFQANQAFNMFQSVTGAEESFIYGYGWAFGIVMAAVVGVVIIGGIKSIAKVTDKVVPFMVVIYVGAALIILGMNFSMIPTAFGAIFDGAFTGAGITGGVVGVLIQGFKRAAFSNEAGIGSASIAHSAVKTKHPASEGLVALLEPFIDTVLVCTMTALVIVITNMNGNIMTYGTEIDEGVRATSNAFASQISWFPYLLAVAVILFAFSSMISWSYYGFQAWTYLFGKNKITEYSYKILFCLFVIVGSAASLGAVINFSDAMIFAMMIPNMIGLVLLSPKVREELNRYMGLIKNKKNS